ncbi:MAG: hypothetical protein KDC49_02310 [Saprospiraceae bacterium]|nr:hypothetical protein [Saprospiraceae bacterium]
MSGQLAENSLLLLFVVAAIGYFLGSIKIKGASLGVAAVLFVGLAFGMVNPRYVVPEIIFNLGLILFVYSVGISSGAAFFQSFRKNGYRDMVFVLIMLFISALFAVGIHFLFDFDRALTTGIYSGSSTNTTAMAAVADLIGGNKKELENIVIGYTYSYPMGVIGVMIVLKFCEKLLKIDYPAEQKLLRKDYPIDTQLTTRSVKVLNESAAGHALRDLYKANDWNIVFSRMTRDGAVSLVNYSTVFQLGDTLMIIGPIEDLEKATIFFGEETQENLYHDRKEYDVQQIFVSNPRMVGRTLASLNLNAKYDAIITRIRRGDTEMLAQPSTVLELGDRIRFIARRKDLKELSKIFGDSYYESSKVNLFSFGLGMALGLLLGTIEFGFPGGLKFKLGMAGGPLIIGLLLGALKRTGPIVWALPYSANVTLRQLGLIMLLAVIGLQSGHSFLESLNDSRGLLLFVAGTIVSMASAFVAVIIGFRIFKIPFSLLLGFLSNQPAILDFATDMSKNRAPVIGYTLMFPIALIMKILFAQILYLLLP